MNLLLMAYAMFIILVTIVSINKYGLLGIMIGVVGICGYVLINNSILGG